MKKIITTDEYIAAQTEWQDGLKQLLVENDSLNTAFEQLTVGKRRDFVEYISEAIGENTSPDSGGGGFE